MKDKISNNHSPFLSIVTVVFNNKNTVERTILSVLNQTYTNFEYIIIDGGSTDGTVDIIKKYGDRIRWISEKDSGIYDAMNKGIKIAKGDWIHILNSDDYYVDNQALEKITPYLINDDKNFYYFIMFQQYLGKRVKYRFKYNFLNYLKLFYSAYLPHPTMVVSKMQYNKVGLYNTDFSIASDHDMILKLCRNYRANFVDIPLTVMTMGGFSGRNIEKNFKEFMDVTVRHGLNPFIAKVIFSFKVFKHRLLKR